jgi:hypothetical protein
MTDLPQRLRSVDIDDEIVFATTLLLNDITSRLSLQQLCDDSLEVPAYWVAIMAGLQVEVAKSMPELRELFLEKHKAVH